MRRLKTPLFLIVAAIVGLVLAVLLTGCAPKKHVQAVVPPTAIDEITFTKQCEEISSTLALCNGVEVRHKPVVQYETKSVKQYKHIKVNHKEK